MNMNKIFLILSLVLIVSLIGCNNNQSDAPSDATSDTNLIVEDIQAEETNALADESLNELDNINLSDW